MAICRQCCFRSVDANGTDRETDKQMDGQTERQTACLISAQYLLPELMLCPGHVLQLSIQQLCIAAAGYERHVFRPQRQDIVPPACPSKGSSAHAGQHCRSITDSSSQGQAGVSAGGRISSPCCVTTAAFPLPYTPAVSCVYQPASAPCALAFLL